MNSTLLLANALALAVLVGFHFVPEKTETVAKRMPHYLQVQRAPQWAVLSDHGGFAPQAVNEPVQTVSTDSTERLVF